MKNDQALLTNYEMNDIKLENRVVMAPMTRSRADNQENSATDLVERFEAKAEIADWDESTFYTPGAKGFTDYPTLKS